MTTKILRFLAEQQPSTPCLIVDLDVIVNNYNAMRNFLPAVEIFYAVKANPAKEVISLLVDLKSCFDAAGRQEIEQIIAAGATTDRILFGNTIKKQKDIAWAYDHGVRLFAFDSKIELQKLAQSAPTSNVFCRLLVNCEGADWSLSKKFGCDIEMARDLMIEAQEKGLNPYGISFHVGSQQTRIDQWDIAIGKTARLFFMLNEAGIELKVINLGGGLPTRYLNDNIASINSHADAIMSAMVKYFGNKMPLMIMEPGRFLIGNAGIIESEVVLISNKSYDENVRWVYLDIGKFGGLAETMNESIKYSIQAPGDGITGPVVLAGPTCDSADILYEIFQYQMPLSLKVGDKVLIMTTGAYTASYSAVNFNGFGPLKTYCI
ncbi:MAG: type III PLP-dependent enzyme [Rhodospirillaceae bacterium]|jgi:ornithine decarboxylase|nr:type III PLP-dependent enzyme [Rhodospirillaceae bacterium]